MSRRSRRRTPKSRGGKSRGGKWMLRISTILLVGVILAGFGVYFWLKSYLHSDDFRVFMGDVVSDAMDAEAQFELFEWQGMDVRTGSFRAGSDGMIRGLKADGIRARLGLGGVSRGVWEVSDVRVSQLDLALDFRDGEEKAAEPTQDERPAVTASEGGGWFDGLLPDRAELKSVEVASAKLSLNTAGGWLRGEDMAVRMDEGDSAGSYDVTLSGGSVDTSWFGSRLDLLSARGKWRDGRIYLTSSEFDVYQSGRLSLSGEVEGSDFGFYGTLVGVRSEELVPPDWQKRILGDVRAEFKVQSGSKDTIVRGKGRLKNGVLTALPVLDHIAAYANTRRFRRLVLSEASLDFWKEGQRLELTEVVLASEGLIRVVGSMTVHGEQLDGRFRVGIVRGTLSHIPGAETKVFLPGEKGLLWAPLRITGTVDNPKEDLSGRLIQAAGERMFELVPETGKKALKFAHDTATQLPGKVGNAADKILEGDPAGAVGEGADIINDGVGGLLDLIPGGAPPKKKEQKAE